MKTVYTLVFFFALAPVILAGPPQKLTSPDQVPDGLAKSDWQSIRDAYEAGRHAFQPTETGWQARNPGQQWLTTFDKRGFLAHPQGADWTWGLELQSYGFGDDQHAISGTPSVEAEGQRLSYQWDANVQEWFVNDTRGLEHGFTVEKRPSGMEGDKPTLRFDLAVRGPLTARLGSEGEDIEFRNGSGSVVLKYAGLKAWDADGKELSSRFETTVVGIRLIVEERDARYPLTIDPIAQQTRLENTSRSGLFNEYFGASVAVSGNTVVVGAPEENSAAINVGGSRNVAAPNSGAAFVFVRNGATWTEQAYLKASNTDADDQFGSSVAISGNTVVVGAPNEDSNGTGPNNNSFSSSGAAYVFTRTGITWNATTYIKASNTNAGDRFGSSVAISGSYILVGAPGEASNGSQLDNSAADSGAAYVFFFNGTSWNQQAYLKARNIGGGDGFGAAVAISGNTAVIGAAWEDSAGTGGSSPLENDNSVNSAGAAYVFFRTNTAWSQQAYLKASNTGASDFFGISVAIDGDTIAIGANGESSSPTAGQGDNSLLGAGAVYVFTRNNGTWSQQAFLKASNPDAFDNFGSSVGVAGDTLVAGAVGEASNANVVNGNQADNSQRSSGAAYVFVRGAGLWIQQAYLKADDVYTSGDNLGYSVGVAGDTVIVGAPYTYAVNWGSAFVFTGLGPAPDIAVSQAVALTDGVSSVAFGYTSVAVGTPLTFTITNPGAVPLTNLVVTKDGTDAGDFAVSALSATSIPVGAGTVTFTVTFSSATVGSKTAALHIASNVDGTKNPFDIALSGQPLSSTTDTDGDGMDDAAEFRLAAEGFDWQVNQAAKVTAFKANLTASGFYTLPQVQALKVGPPLIQKDPVTGQFRIILGLQKSTNLLEFEPFPMTAPQTLINGDGKVEWIFTSPNAAEFYRIEVSQ